MTLPGGLSGQYLSWTIVLGQQKRSEIRHVDLGSQRDRDHLRLSMECVVKCEIVAMVETRLSEFYDRTVHPPWYINGVVCTVFWRYHKIDVIFYLLDTYPLTVALLKLKTFSFFDSHNGVPIFSFKFAYGNLNTKSYIPGHNSECCSLLSGHVPRRASSWQIGSLVSHQRGNWSADYRQISRFSNKTPCWFFFLPWGSLALKAPLFAACQHQTSPH